MPSSRSRLMIPKSLTRFSLSSPSAPIRSIARFLVILLADVEDERRKKQEQVWGNCFDLDAAQSLVRTRDPFIYDHLVTAFKPIPTTRLNVTMLHPSMQHSLAEFLCVWYASGLKFATTEHKIAIGNSIPRYIMEFFPGKVTVLVTWISSALSYWVRHGLSDIKVLGGCPKEALAIINVKLSSFSRPLGDCSTTVVAVILKQSPKNAPRSILKEVPFLYLFM